QDKAAGRRQYKWYGTDPPGASSPWGTVPFGPGRGNPYRFLFIRHIVLKHRPEPDIIRPSTSVKIFFLTGQTE
ncbi:hypothetical protein IBS95_001014, partial [Neisseria gonorrhoeae]